MIIKLINKRYDDDIRERIYAANWDRHCTLIVRKSCMGWSVPMAWCSITGLLKSCFEDSNMVWYLEQISIQQLILPSG